jgi:hypothetical protein
MFESTTFRLLFALPTLLSGKLFVIYVADFLSEVISPNEIFAQAPSL